MEGSGDLSVFYKRFQGQTSANNGCQGLQIGVTTDKRASRKARNNRDRKPWANPAPILGRDQLSVHTNRAATLLIRRLIGRWAMVGSGGWYLVTP